MLWMNEHMISWFTVGYYYFACDVSSVAFVVAFFLKLISVFAGVFWCRWSFVFSSWASKVRGRNKQVISSLTRPMIDDS